MKTTQPGGTAYERALVRLARRAHSEEETRGALARDGFSASEVERALVRLRANRYVDDVALAGGVARTALERQRVGRLQVRRTLRRRGVSAEAAGAGLAEALREVSEADVLDTAARRYWTLHTKDEPARRLRRLAAHLVRRGFPGALVQERLARLWPRWSEALEEMGTGDGARDEDGGETMD